MTSSTLTSSLSLKWRAMLQAKGPAARAGEDAGGKAALDIPVPDVSGAAASARGDFLERLAAANQRAQSLDR